MSITWQISCAQRNEIKIGNPLSDGVWDYTWQQGRQLATMSNGSTTWTYTYDANGMRIGRTNGTDSYTYIYSNGLLTRMVKNDTMLLFTYDAAGMPLTVHCNGFTYYYVTNLQGDVIAILDGNGNAVVEYMYNAWGELLGITGSMRLTLGLVNPLRYRSYVYDHETGLYYLQSRYYNPEIGRFISADNYPSTGQGLTGNNMFAYCGNNPVSRNDDGGEFWHIVIGAAIGAAVSFGASILSDVVAGEEIDWVGAGVSAAFGAVSGALAASGVGALGSALASVAIDGTEYVVSSVIEGKEINQEELLATVAISALTAGKGIDGAKLSGIYRHSTNVLKTAVSPKKIAMYTAKKTNVLKTVFSSIGGTIVEGVAGGVADGFKRRFSLA